MTTSPRFVVSTTSRTSTSCDVQYIDAVLLLVVLL